MWAGGLTRRAVAALRLIALAAAAFLLLGGLTACPSRAKREFPDSLIVPPRAREVQYGKHHGVDQVSYKIEIDYPADEILSLIATTLKSKGVWAASTASSLPVRPWPRSTNTCATSKYA